MSAIATIGFGEAAQAFVSGWRSEDGVSLGQISTFDIKVEAPSLRDNLRHACSDLDVTCGESPRHALAGAVTVFSLVTADRALQAAANVAEFLERDALYLDCNSCSPATKAAAARLVEAAGAVYVDVAVMSPVHPARHRTPLLLSGSEAKRAHNILLSLGMKPEIAGDEVGKASSIKMLRSVMIKGFEALTAECMLAARRAGVEKAVLASLQASDPGIDWTARAAYNLERMIVHGRRRAAEMQEVAATLRELGLPDRMAAAAADWQRQIGELGITAPENSVEARADAILERNLT
ncbi:3-hydroxyisobutyrate dehydrogenase-like beta-hydroxyacid dehydrogenase [Rhizobium sp. BK619]|uniref:NAD(P)-dependent oxidoreductase n=1 Tax=Rhizobium sp. BK619 TaxID=2586989 RepID=UPI001612C752|nr:NAD(P)-dependent oxidoreductase [Rhizobium sp. BK619]MBB3646280.1 3-hydroxyisobutyrate dehydrogenase-like beta-hydroxyacid dehydrogenase [Rhizobium sp. BK619]